MASSARSRSSSRTPSNNFSYPSAYNYNHGTPQKPRSSTSMSMSTARTSTSPPRRPITPSDPRAPTADMTEKQPAFATTALNITVPSISPPSTHSASSNHETLYLHRSRLSHRLRLVLCVPLLSTAVTILACQGHALRFYNRSNLSTAYMLPLWGGEGSAIDMRPLISCLVAGGITASSCVVYMLAAVIPSPRPRTSVLRSLFAALTIISLLSSLFALILTTYLKYHPTTNHTIDSWTCLWSSGAATFNAGLATLQIPDLFLTVANLHAPAGFDRVCRESHVSWAVLIALVALELLGGLGLVAWDGWVERAIARERKMAMKRDGDVGTEAEKGPIVGGGGGGSRMSW